MWNNVKIQHTCSVDVRNWGALESRTFFLYTIFMSTHDVCIIIRPKTKEKYPSHRGIPTSNGRRNIESILTFEFPPWNLSMIICRIYWNLKTLIDHKNRNHGTWRDALTENSPTETGVFCNCLIEEKQILNLVKIMQNFQGAKVENHRYEILSWTKIYFL